MSNIDTIKAELDWKEDYDDEKDCNNCMETYKCTDCNNCAVME